MVDALLSKMLSSVLKLLTSLLTKLNFYKIQTFVIILNGQCGYWIYLSPISAVSIRRYGQLKIERRYGVAHLCKSNS